MTDKSPLSSKQLARRRDKSLSPEGLETLVPFGNFAMNAGSDLVIRRDLFDENILRFFCRVGKDGLPPVRRREDIKAVQLDPKSIGETHLKVRELDGNIPDGTKVTVNPERAELTTQQKAILRDLERGEKTDDDRGATIFGSDDRYLFFDRSYPWRTTGRVRTAGGTCAGCTIGPRLVLTASHCINWSTDGTSAGWITFSPGFYDGDQPWGEIAATQIIYWNPALGLLSDQETAFDYAVLVMEEEIGNVVGYPGYRTYNDDWNGGAFWQIIGYPGDLSGAQRPSFQGDAPISSVQDRSLNGQTGFVMGHFNDITPGNSGGPCWGWWADEPWPRVVGVASTIGSTAVETPTGSTNGDNEFGAGPALSSLISWARSNFPA
ncbi:MAG: trypsin-like serine protease [Pseudomonadota bacterium]